MMAALSCAATVAVTSYSSFRSSSCTTTADFTAPVSAVAAGVRSARLVWSGQQKQRRAETQLRNVVVAAATAVEEATPAVTTEAVPRPKKVGKGVVRLRLTRLGRKKRPFYRIVAIHSSWRRDGKYIELLGHYNPLHAKEDLGIVVKADRINPGERGQLSRFDVIHSPTSSWADGGS